MIKKAEISEASLVINWFQKTLNKKYLLVGFNYRGIFFDKIKKRTIFLCFGQGIAINSLSIKHLFD